MRKGCLVEIFADGKKDYTLPVESIAIQKQKFWNLKVWACLLF